MLRKLLFSAALLASSVVFAAAQTSGDFNKFEVFGGYSNNQVDVGLNSQSGNAVQNFFNDRESFNGFNASVVSNLNRYVGIKGDVSGHYKTFDVNFPTSATQSLNLEVKSSVYNFLGGVQIKENAKEGSRLRPFGHALVGAAHGKNDVEGIVCIQVVGVVCPSVPSTSDTGFAAAIGGGLDIKATDRISIRAVQLDYNPNRFDGSTSHNFRFGVGVVFH